MAVAIMATGMIFVGGVFPVAIRFSTIATERTTAAIVADEAFAKIKLITISHGIKASDFNYAAMLSFEDVVNAKRAIQQPPLGKIDVDEFMYPSTTVNRPKKYSWAALCSRVIGDTNSVQVTVFVCSKTTENYRDPIAPLTDTVTTPQPVPVTIKEGSNNSEIWIDNSAEDSFINDGYTVVDELGNLYRVLERDVDTGYLVTLEKGWRGVDLSSVPTGTVWTVPPPVNGGKGPCLAVYQKIIRL